MALRTLPSLAALADCFTISAPAGVPVFVDNAMLGKGPRLVVMATRGATYQVSAVIDGQLKRAAVRFPEVRAVTLP